MWKKDMLVLYFRSKEQFRQYFKKEKSCGLTSIGQQTNNF